MKIKNFILLSIILTAFLSPVVFGDEDNQISFNPLNVRVATVSACDTECMKQRLNTAWQRFLNQISVQGTATATAGSTQIPFGGTISSIFLCPCNASIAFTINPVAGPAGPYIVSLPLALKQFKSLLPGNWTLGAAEPIPTPCLTAFLCLPKPVPFTVVPTPGVGTSLTP